LLHAAEWREHPAGASVVKEGEMDDRFFVILNGEVDVVSHGHVVGRLGRGGCFGESSYVATARRAATIRTVSDVTLLAMTSTMLETLSMSCQLRFNQMFLKSLIRRLHDSPAAEQA
jgi:CRP-like cAMP-binding protein